MTDPRVYAAPNPAAERQALVVNPKGTGDRALLFAVLGPPVAWTIDSLLSIAMHHDFCAAIAGREFAPWPAMTALLTAVGVLMLLASLSGGAVAWRAHARLGDDTGAGDTDLDRRRFMARAGMLTCALFSYAIALRVLTLVFFGPRHCGA